MIVAGRIGDVVFGASGQPGVIHSRNPQNGRVKVDVEKENVLKTHRHGYVNGLDQKEREFFNSEMDRFKQIEDDRERVVAMKEKIEQLKNDPTKTRMARYLESELFHFMSTRNIQPKMYTTELL